MADWCKAHSGKTSQSCRSPGSRPGSATIFAGVAQRYEYLSRTRRYSLERSVGNRCACAYRKDRKLALANDFKVSAKQVRLLPPAPFCRGSSVVVRHEQPILMGRTQVRFLPSAPWKRSSVVEHRYIIWPKVGGSIPSVSALRQGLQGAPDATCKSSPATSFYSWRERSSDERASAGPIPVGRAVRSGSYQCIDNPNLYDNYTRMWIPVPDAKLTEALKKLDQRIKNMTPEEKANMAAWLNAEVGSEDETWMTTTEKK